MIYQKTYAEGFTTDLPDDATLNALIGSDFRDHQKDYGGYLETLRQLGFGPPLRLFDYGCSWGYGSYQMAKAGYDVEAYEISRLRSDFAASRLGVRTREPSRIEQSAYDVFFSAHVIEHVPSPRALIDLGMNALKPRGVFVCFTPNGSAARRQVAPRRWHESWGFVHPQLIDELFLEKLPAEWGCYASSASNHRPTVKRATSSDTAFENLAEEELLFVLRKPGPAIASPGTPRHAAP